MGIAAHSKRLYPNLCPHSWCTSCFYQSWSAIERPLSDRVTTHHEPLVFPLWREWKWGWLYLLKNVCKNRVPSILPSYFQQGHKVIWPSIFPKKKKRKARGSWWGDELACQQQFVLEFITLTLFAWWTRFSKILLLAQWLTHHTHIIIL